MAMKAFILKRLIAHAAAMHYSAIARAGVVCMQVLAVARSCEPAPGMGFIVKHSLILAHIEGAVGIAALK